MYTTDIHMEFPDERSRKDFENCFKGWVTEWQTQQFILRRLIDSTVERDEVEDSSAGLIPPQAHHIGVGPPDATAGLIGINDLSITLSDGTTVDIGGLYLNIIPGW